MHEFKKACKMQAGMGITDDIIQGKISCFRNKFHKHKEKCSEKRKFLGALCLRSEIPERIYSLPGFFVLAGMRRLPRSTKNAKHSEYAFRYPHPICAICQRNCKKIKKNCEKDLLSIKNML